MPELPEVETIVRDLREKIIGQTMDVVQIFDGRVIRFQSPSDFKKGLRGKKISSVNRRAKAIILHFSPKGFLTIQLGMTGQLIYDGVLKKKEKSTKIIFQLADGSILRYNDQRMFGRLTFTYDLDTMSFFQNLGYEPLDSALPISQLFDKLKRRTLPIKTLLMDQSFLVGIGNIYASEICFLSGMNPKKSAQELTQKEFQNILKKTIFVLKKAIKWRGTTFKDYRDSRGEKGGFIRFIKVYGREGLPCYHCKSSIFKIVQSGRSTFFCQQCQGMVK